MGRSATSCFKIISCAGSDDSVDRDEIDASSENKGQRVWSFRKRAARHRVLSNTVVTEPPSSENKAISEPIISSESQIIPNISEKTSDNIWTEEIPNSTAKNATVSVIDTESAIKDDTKCEPVPDESESKSESESSILVIQAAVRRFLAQRRFVKQKNVVKLQAAVRGHLVRTHAVGTLRCVQAIVKVQTLVRARQEKGVQNAGINLKRTHISIEKLLSNRLARQLLESTPKTKQINIKCDPLKSDSAWNWLERWMSVSSPETLESCEPKHDQDEVIVNNENEGKIVISSNVVEPTVPSEEKENSIDIEENINVKNHTEEDLLPESMVSETEPKPIPENPVSETQIKPIPENPVSETQIKPIPENPVSETEIKLIPVNQVSETEIKPIPENLVSENEPKPIPENLVLEPEPKGSAKRLAVDQPDSEGRKSVFGSRKASNPAFIAAQSRFEELTSQNNPLKSPNSSNQENVSEPDPSKPQIGSSNPNGPSADSAPENPTPFTDIEPPVNHGSRVVQAGGSECGAELSITSTLDSPDQFEIGIKNIEQKPEPEVLDEPATNVEPEPVPEPEPEPVHKPETGPQVSIQGSPTSHITIPESQGTPSSQVSTNTKKSKPDKTASSQSQKRKSWSTSKKSSVDSGLRSSLEQLPKDPKPGKRRNSFGSPKPNHIDAESRDNDTNNNNNDNNNNNCVPSYMQATESAKLKAVASISPRSSPDLQEKEIYLKKRHSLPGAVNGRQGSPRIQRSMSQALQNTKGNGNQVTEKKWQR